MRYIVFEKYNSGLRLYIDSTGELSIVNAIDEAELFTLTNYIDTKEPIEPEGLTEEQEEVCSTFLEGFLAGTEYAAETMSRLAKDFPKRIYDAEV
jgi:hypothetical protein